MSVMRKIGAPLRRLPSNVAGQTVVTYAIMACLLAAILVLATSVPRVGGQAANQASAEDAAEFR